MSHLAAGIIYEEHAAVSAVLRSLLAMIRQGPDTEPGRFFDVLRAMLFYIDEFPERRHHPKESNLLFPKLARARPELMPVIDRDRPDLSPAPFVAHLPPEPPVAPVAP